MLIRTVMTDRPRQPVARSQTTTFQGKCPSSWASWIDGAGETAAADQGVGRSAGHGQLAIITDWRAFPRTHARTWPLARCVAAEKSLISPLVVCTRNRKLASSGIARTRLASTSMRCSLCLSSGHVRIQTILYLGALITRQLAQLILVYRAQSDASHATMGDKTWNVPRHLTYRVCLSNLVRNAEVCKTLCACLPSVPKYSSRAAVKNYRISSVNPIGLATEFEIIKIADKAWP
jgi:hypothetical protein